jgi:putative hemolysin
MDEGALLNLYTGSRIGSALIRSYFKSFLSSSQLKSTLHKMNRRERSTPFCTAALNSLNVAIRVDGRNWDTIPKSGATVVVSNHPFGALEGLILIEYMSQIRKDVKILANSFLSIFPSLREHCLFVNPFGSKNAHTENLKATRAALEWVTQGGMLIVFPAGEVSHFSLKQRCVTDPLWNKTAARIAIRANATIVPVYFSGANSLKFQIAGLVHPMLRTALLPSEVFNKKGRTIQFRIGMPINRRKTLEFDSPDSLNDYIRTRTYALAGRESTIQKTKFSTKRQETIIPPIADTNLEKELEALDVTQCLVKHKEMSVYIAQADQMPLCLREIGRLREETFRRVGEGTSKSIDLDEYDRYYLHLILWDDDRRQIAGAYRLGPTDTIVSQNGFKGLYTNSLFSFSREMKQRLIPALELGRSFVSPEYQRKPMSLALLWKGIGQYIVANPQYRFLFGPVSISAEYKDTSKQLMLAYFQRLQAYRQSNKLIRPKNRVKRPLITKWDMEGVLRGLYSENDLSTVISEMEEDAKGIPVLLKQYLNLHGKILAFNLDQDFSDVIDGLIMVDLLETRPHILQRFMGKQEANKFIEYHKAKDLLPIAS